MKPLLALLRRDFRLAWRIGGGAGMALGFFVLACTLVALGTGGAPESLLPLAPAALWIAMLLAVLLSLDRMFQSDYEDGTLALIMRAPIPLEGAVMAKIFAHWLATGAPLTLAAPVAGLAFHMPPAAFWTIALGAATGGLALFALGAVSAALSLSVRRGGLLLSLLWLPLAAPVMVLGSASLRAAASGGDAAAALILLGANALFALALAPCAAAAALRAHMG